MRSLFPAVVLLSVGALAVCEPGPTTPLDTVAVRQAQSSSPPAPPAVRVTVSCTQDVRLRAVWVEVRFASDPDPVRLRCFYHELGPVVATAVVEGLSGPWEVWVLLDDLLEDFVTCRFEGSRIPSGALRCTNLSDPANELPREVDRDAHFLNAGATVLLEPASPGDEG